MDKILEKFTEPHKEWIDEVWEKIDKKMKVVSAKSIGKIPYTTFENGDFDDCGAFDISWWTNGFWAGYMWLLYVGTGDEIYKKTAENAEEILDRAFLEYDKLNHDVGFMWHISAGVNYRITGNEKSRLRWLLAADMLAARFNPRGGYIRAWNDAEDGAAQKVIIDSMMNITMLYRASEHHGDNRYKSTAMLHADKLIKTHIRDDGTARHIVRLDEKTGEAVETLAGQGYSADSSWTRGQAWAIYGFVLSYIHTGKREYLDTAKRVANAFAASAGSRDWIIPIDFCQPYEDEYYDSSAAATAACGFIELARVCGDNGGRVYFDAAVKLLRRLDERTADYSTDRDNILGFSSEAYRPWRGDAGINTSIIYADYFYTEAFYKLKGNEMLFW